MNFETELIENAKYKRYEVIRGILFILFFIYSIPAYFMSKSAANREAFSDTIDLKRNKIS